jgi:hypothetical protein
MNNRRKPSRDGQQTRRSESMPRARTTQRNSRNTFDEMKRLLKRRWKVLVEIVGVMLLALYTVSAISTCEINRDTLHQTMIANRPVIDAHTAVLQPLKVGDIPRATVSISNAGPTPAVDLQAGTRLQVGAMPLFLNIAYESWDEDPVTIPKDKTLTIEITGEHPLTEQEASGIASGMELKVHGELVFCSPASTVPLPHVHFCFALEPKTGRMLNCDNFGEHTDKGKFKNSLQCHPSNQ